MDGSSVISDLWFDYSLSILLKTACICLHHVNLRGLVMQQALAHSASCQNETYICTYRLTSVGWH